jgi:hypothetical protein
MRRSIVAVCLAAAPVLALATIYKVQMPDGSILFTDTPPAGAKILEERASGTARPAPRPAPAPAGAAGASDRPPIAVLPTPMPRGERPTASTVLPNTLDAANTEVTAAERELNVARRKLEVGREPLAGERLGTAKGGSRLSPEYESRIAGLEQEVAAAEDRLRRAYEARNALK